jgi:hypothetical protein
VGLTRTARHESERTILVLKNYKERIMSAIASISSSFSSMATQAAQATQRTPEASEVKGAPDNDGDADDGGATSVKATTQTLNLSGQKIGQLINVSA